MSWFDPLIDMVGSGLTKVAEVMLPTDSKRQIRQKFRNLNPFTVISGNHDLLRAARLSWCEATIAVLNVAQQTNSSDSSQNEVISFARRARQHIDKIIKNALNRSDWPGNNPIDAHLQSIMQGTPEFITPSENKLQSEALTNAFKQTLAEIVGCPLTVIPSKIEMIIRNGIPMPNAGPTRNFDELVFAEFAEILKSPDRYPEASEAFKIYTQEATRKLTQAILDKFRGFNSQIDQMIYKIDSFLVFQQGAEQYLHQILADIHKIRQYNITILKNLKVVRRDTEIVRRNTEKIITDNEKIITAIQESRGNKEQLNPNANISKLPSSRQQLRDLIDQGEWDQLKNGIPSNLYSYQAQCFARSVESDKAVDKQFIPLTLWIDQNEDISNPSKSPKQTYYDLSEVLDEVAKKAIPVMVVTGAPGSGKSTLLRRLEFDLAHQALFETHEDEIEVPVTLFMAMNAYKAPRGKILDPRSWLEEGWKTMCCGFLTFDELMRHRLILLLDGLNEMPYASRDEHSNQLKDWKIFLDNLKHHYPKVRVIFSCRTIDYGHQLRTESLPSIPCVEINPLSEEQIEAFLLKYSPDQGESLFRQLMDKSQLELFRSPIYLKMLIEQSSDGEIPNGRTALFTKFVRALLKREIIKDNPRLQRDDVLIRGRDRERIQQGKWRNDFELPKQSQLFSWLSMFAFELQNQHQIGDESNKRLVRIDFEDALCLLSKWVEDENLRLDLIKIAVDLKILDRAGEDILFTHQLLQEYFAARYLAQCLNQQATQEILPLIRLAENAWRGTDINPSALELLNTLPVNATLPDLPSTGWEETFSLATPLIAQPDEWIRALAEVNLPLAGRCAAQSDVELSAFVRETLQHQLVARSRDPNADLRARIQAGFALGELGDRRFQRLQGKTDRYLLPPMVTIAAGSYPMGSDEGVENEAPPHHVTLEAFQIGQFPVTNAEFRCFIEAGGYQQENWWQTEAAKRWRRGEGTGDADKNNWRHWRGIFQSDEDRLLQLAEEQALSEQSLRVWQGYCAMPDTKFEMELNELFPNQQWREPKFWHNPAFRSPNQPVVGVSWFEVMAYCAWLSAQTGKPYRLLTESEWEAAARGMAGRRYPWGDDFQFDHCNSLESKWRRTTPIGVFPQGDVQIGNDFIADLAGNVWEWTLSTYRPYLDQVRDDQATEHIASLPRVLRGGSWSYDAGWARSAFCGSDNPDSRNNYYGFRLALDRNSL